MAALAKQVDAVDRSELDALVGELPAFAPLPVVCRFLGNALTVRQLRRLIEQGRIRALRTNARGSGRLLLARGEVARLVRSMAANV